MSNPLLSGAAVQLPSIPVPSDLKRSIEAATGLEFTVEQVERIADCFVTYVQFAARLMQTIPPEDARVWYRGTAAGARRMAARLQAACAGSARHKLALVQQIGENRLAQIANDLRDIAVESDKLRRMVRDTRESRRVLFANFIADLGVIVRAAGGSTSAQYNPGMETPFVRLVTLLEGLIPPELARPRQGLRLRHANVGKAVVGAQRRVRSTDTTMTRTRKKILTSSH